MAGLLHTTSAAGGLTVTAHRGDGSVLLAFNLEEHLTDHLAGFAVQRTAPGGKPEPLLNRLSFGTRYTAATTAADRRWRPSDRAPFQKFRPAPFAREVTEGLAHKIHPKFVVVDFNDSDPVLFTGSSNLAEGGEENNGDNLLAIYDREMAVAYAVEAIRLVDHYHFRAALSRATTARPLRLREDREKWWQDYYREGSIKRRERLLFAR